ncbi:16S rRNA (uracil(1498)-N(3))-methyltransferase [Prevotella sp. OH937_COT-195]|uniref:16S rRNA (uracil(1498)-N(3))-methyltransferase n=1 Tax=Prevotella sp. OH937_COT-195 TaxID=2491051 RepID=UPI000F64A6D2|nr:16S rRNA (uracil(1498)-N(3))-methyltransferase [Prevotella sp. OH937_COT-195]RRD01905.1 16S rRNA (uracil(1498)-N(3))-methyltransferase [Prevotella sp. OH937_COT-195]
MKEARYFFVPDAGNTNELPDDEAMHALRVLRLKSGDEMFLMDGEGCFYRTVVTLAATKRCLYKVSEIIPQVPVWKGRICIATAPTKMMDRMEWFVEKATEIGIDDFSFLNCRFSERRMIKTARLEKIIVSAVKQSRKAWKPALNQMMTFNNFVSLPISGRKYIAHCYDEIERRDLFTELQKPFSDNEADVTVMIGPEGDFSTDEVRLAIDYGFVPVSLGPCRLRTETAALSAAMMAHLSRRIMKH